MLTQGNQNFEKMLTMGKDNGDRSGLWYNTTNTSSHNKGQTNAFIRGKGKTQVPTQPLKQKSMTYGERQSHKGKKPLTYKRKTSSQKSKNFGNMQMGQIAYQRSKAFNNRRNTSYKGKAIDTSQALTSKSKRSYSGKPYSSFKGNTPMNNERGNDSWKNNFHAFTSKNPPITCYYYGLVDHVKLDCRKKDE